MTGWSKPVTVSDPEDRAGRPTLTLGRNGQAVLVRAQGDTFRRLMTSSRVNGAWSAAPVPLNTGAGDYAIGQIAVGPDNRPVAVWDESTGDFTTQVRAATTAPAPFEPLPEWRDFSGDGKGDLLALNFGRDTGRAYRDRHRRPAYGCYSDRLAGHVDRRSVRGPVRGRLQRPLEPKHRFGGVRALFVERVRNPLSASLWLL